MTTSSKSLFTPNVNIGIPNLQFRGLRKIRNYSAQNYIDKRHFPQCALDSSRSVYNYGKDYHFHSPMSRV